MAGLSGGQRKILLFELISQRTVLQENLLIILDEPFAGVTDDFVPFIVGRLNEMRVKHNVLLVTNDHVETLKLMADNIITVSAIDRGKVRINRMHEGVDRDLAILAMAIGDNYKHEVNSEDLLFFGRVELSKNGGIPTVAMFSVFMYGLFTLTFWGSKPGSEAFILVAAEIISFHIVHPYVLQLVDWRIYMIEEAEALMHSSKNTNKLLKAMLMLFVVFVVACIQFSCMFAVTLGYLTGVDFFFAVLFDNLSQLIPLILLGLYSDLPDQAVQVLGQLPWLLMIFFSTTFSPGAGIVGIKELRYLFSRYYLWCMLPDENEMEGCPENNTLLYLILSSLFLPCLFATWKLSQAFYDHLRQVKKTSSQRKSMQSTGFAELQLELFGEKALNKLKQFVSKELLELTYRLYRDRSTAEDSSNDGNTSDEKEDTGEDTYISDLRAYDGDGPIPPPRLLSVTTGESDSFVSSLMKLEHVVGSSDLEDLISKHRLELDKVVARTAIGTSSHGCTREASFSEPKRDMDRWTTGSPLDGYKMNRWTIGSVPEVYEGRPSDVNRSSIATRARDLLSATGEYASRSLSGGRW